MSVKTTAAAAAFLLIGAGTAIAAECPTPTVVKTLTGAPIFAHTSLAKFWFANVDDNARYGMPLDAVVDAAGNLITGALDPNGCRPPLRGRSVTAAQIAGMVTQNMAIQGLNAAFGTKMPWITITFDVTTDTFDTVDGPVIIVQAILAGE
jgi:hypothetical protein